MRSKPGLTLRVNQRRICRRQGFTLVEVLVAAVILSVGLTAVFNVFLSSIDVVQLFDNRLNAQFFLNEKIKQLQAELNRQSGMFIPMDQSGQVEIGNKVFSWRLNMQVVDAYQELYRVNALMDWSEGDKIRKIKHQVMVKSFYSNANPWKENTQ